MRTTHSPTVRASVASHQMSAMVGSCTVSLSGQGLYSEVQCIMGNGHMATPQTELQTPVKTIPSRSFVGGRQ